MANRDPSLFRITLIELASRIVHQRPRYRELPFRIPEPCQMLPRLFAS